MPPQLTARAMERRIRALGNPRRAVGLQRFFKTGPGEYGEGDRFLGLTMPHVRGLVPEFTGATLEELERLLESPWHEARMVALVVLAVRYPQADTSTRVQIYRLYLRRSDRINNWDLVDVTAPAIVGVHLRTRSRAVLRRLASSSNLWERRIAIVSTYTFIRDRQYADTLHLARMLLADSHDLMHKAVGWMLREVGKRDEPTLLRFLDEHAGRMPRTMLRYAIERLSTRVRRHYMRVPRVG